MLFAYFDPNSIIEGLTARGMNIIFLVKFWFFFLEDLSKSLHTDLFWLVECHSVNVIVLLFFFFGGGGGGHSTFWLPFFSKTKQKQQAKKKKKKSQNDIPHVKTVCM